MAYGVFLLRSLEDITSPETRIEETAEVHGDLDAEEVESSNLVTGVAWILS